MVAPLAESALRARILREIDAARSLGAMTAGSMT